MSRKDPRRRMMVPLSARERAALRVLAHRGLGDALRRLVAQELDCGITLQKLTAAERALPLQLPRNVQQQLMVSARQLGMSGPELARQALLQHLRKRGVVASEAQID